MKFWALVLSVQRRLVGKLHHFVAINGMLRYGAVFTRTPPPSFYLPLRVPLYPSHGPLPPPPRPLHPFIPLFTSLLITNWQIYYRQSVAWHADRGINRQSVYRGIDSLLYGAQRYKQSVVWCVEV